MLGKALMIVGGPKPKPHEEEEEYAEEMPPSPPNPVMQDVEFCMEEFVKALEAKDTKAMATAFHSAMTLVLADCD